MACLVAFTTNETGIVIDESGLVHAPWVINEDERARPACHWDVPLDRVKYFPVIPVKENEHDD